jgi:nucleotide-binding universal stress UspA family protein
MGLLYQKLNSIEKDYLSAIVDRIRDAAGGNVEASLLAGSVADALTAYILREQPDLVVMTTRDRGSVGRFWFGSVADSLIRQTSVPVLLAAASGAADAADPAFKVEHILVPLDGSELAEQVVEHAAALAAALQARITLLGVILPMLPERYPPTSATIIGPVFEDLEALHEEEVCETRKYLESVAESPPLRGFDVQTQVVAHEQPATAILEAAAAGAADLLVMATQGRGGLKRMLLGSVADKVVRAASIPILVYRPSEEAAAAGEDAQRMDRWLDDSFGERWHAADDAARV